MSERGAVSAQPCPSEEALTQAQIQTLIDGLKKLKAQRQVA